MKTRATGTKSILRINSEKPVGSPSSSRMHTASQVLPAGRVARGVPIKLKVGDVASGLRVERIVVMHLANAPEHVFFDVGGRVVAEGLHSGRAAVPFAPIE